MQRDFLVRFTKLRQAERALEESNHIVGCKITPRLWIERLEGSLSHRPCFNCLFHGHVASRCRAAAVCRKCGEDHSLDKCNSDALVCVNCDTTGDHMAGSYVCLYFQSWARRAICTKVGLKKSLWPEEFFPSRVHRRPPQRVFACPSPPPGTNSRTTNPPADHPTDFPALSATTVLESASYGFSTRGDAAIFGLVS